MGVEEEAPPELLARLRLHAIGAMIRVVLAVEAIPVCTSSKNPKCQAPRWGM